MPQTDALESKSDSPPRWSPIKIIYNCFECCWKLKWIHQIQIPWSYLSHTWYWWSKFTSTMTDHLQSKFNSFDNINATLMWQYRCLAERWLAQKKLWRRWKKRNDRYAHRWKCAQQQQTISQKTKLQVHFVIINHTYRVLLLLWMKAFSIVIVYNKCNNEQKTKKITTNRGWWCEDLWTALDEQCR